MNSLATKERLKRLAYADLLRECSMFEILSSPVKIRQATQDELNKYRNLVMKQNERLHKEFNRKVR